MDRESCDQWDWRPGKLRSLWEIMQEFDAGGFLAVMRGLAVVMANDDNDFIEESMRVHISKSFTGYLPLLGKIGLIGSRASAKKLILELNKGQRKWRHIKPVCKEIQERLIDEMDAKIFFALTPRETDFYDAPRAAWKEALARFPAILDDVEEASKCLALSRYPASVFHSVQIVEAGLIELGGFLRVNDPLSGWTAVAGALKKVIDKKHGDRTTFEKKNFAFLEQTQGTVEGLKNAWRNKISHAGAKLTVMGKEFSPEVAEEILFATRAFMRRLAEGLPPPKKKRGEV